MSSDSNDVNLLTNISKIPSNNLECVMVPEHNSVYVEELSERNSNSCSDSVCEVDELKSSDDPSNAEDVLESSYSESISSECNTDNNDKEAFILPISLNEPNNNSEHLATSSVKIINLTPASPLHKTKQRKISKSKIKKKNTETSYICEVCNKGFCSSSSLLRHCRLHTGEKPFSCPVCPKTFTSNFRLKSHYLIHTGDTPYECKICSRGFRDKSDLVKHEMGHTGIRPFVCDVCNKSYLQKCLLQSHYRCHTGEKPYPCEACGRCFSNKRQLQVHFRIHTGEKPYSCSVCCKTFNLSGNLKKHFRTHTGEKPYNCNVCNKYFSDSSSLAKHRFIHLGQKPHVCYVCEKSYTKKSTLRAHILSHKNSEPENEMSFSTQTREKFLMDDICTNNEITNLKEKININPP